MAHPTDGVVVREHVADYDGTHVPNSRRYGLAFVGLLSLSVALVACEEVGPNASDRAPVAEQFATETANCGDVPLPPAEFDHAAAIPVLVQRVPFDSVDRKCRDAGVVGPRTVFGTLDGHGLSRPALLSKFTNGDFETKACSWTFARLGFVVLPESGKAGVTENWEACALRHEIGHINGWPNSHPYAHYDSPTPITASQSVRVTNPVGQDGPKNITPVVLKSEKGSVRQGRGRHSHRTK